MPEVPTREIFRELTPTLQVSFYLLAAVFSAVFVYGFYRRVVKYRRGRSAEGRFTDLPARIARAFGTIGRNATIWHRDAYAGLSHTLIFWGFVVLFIGTCIVGLDHDILRHLGIHLLQGSFYLGFSLVLDVFGVFFIAGLVMMMVRRRFWKLPQLDYRRADAQGGHYDRAGYDLDDRLFAGLLLVIALTGFLLEGLRIAADRPPFEVWSAVGWRVAGLIDAVGLTPLANSLHLYTWWFHAVVVLAFIAYIPYSKAMHMLLDIANLVFTDEMSARRLPPQPESAEAPVGYTHLTDFTWKELLDLDACTKCGRCHVACPARAAGTTLSPRDLILDLRTEADATFGVGEWLTQKFLPGSSWPRKAPAEVDVATELIRAETLWSCTTCMACVEACPVGIEHLTHIVEMRRHLVDTGTMEPSLQEALTNLGEYGNSFGKPSRARGKWTEGLPFKIKDARKERVEYLWYVGDYASFDPRLQDISRTVARVLAGAGVDFGVLYDGERNAGNDVRRVGEEGLYQMLVEENMETLKRAKFGRIFTTDPHTFNTLRNEYPALENGDPISIDHYTGLVAKLIAEGKLKLQKKLGYKVTYHDPCYLGRYNRETSAPRRVLEGLGVELMEMPRCGTNTFCCGAGGGRIWMDDSNQTERPSEMRIREALGLDGVQYFVTACPKDYTMYTDAVKTSGNEGKIVVKDIIELVDEALS
jgi:Fe-S oxidoreductase